MNNNPDFGRKFDEESADRMMYYREQKNKKRKIKLIAVSCIFAALVIMCIIGIFRTFSGSHVSFKVIVNGIYDHSIGNEEYTLSKKELSLDSDWKGAEENVISKIESVYNKYRNGKLSYDETVNVINAFSQLNNANERCAELLGSIDKIETGRRSFEAAKDLKIDNDLAGALKAYLSVSPEDELNYKTAQDKAKQIEAENPDAVSYIINTYLCKFEIEEARSLVNDLIDKLGENDFLLSEKDRIEKYYTDQTDLVEFEGHVEHLFTHCLIAYPELCYSSPSMTASLDEDCITPSEFIKILNSLYEKNYILIDINMLINETADGVEIGKVMIPKGKTPFVFSVDDVTYDSRKMHTGMVDKLIVGEDGRVCTYTLHADGTEVISYENEAFPIIDEFVRQHPDFTFQGARGTLCNTGFDGVLGYRTQKNPKEDVDPEYEKEQAKLVVAALKEEGWTFASHSYGHGHMDQSSFDYVKEDTDSWIEEVVPIIGETKIMVWPYGGSIRDGEEHKYIYDAGFRLFCGVGVDPFVVKEPDGYGIFMDRKALDGYSLRNRHDRYLYLFDTEEVWDPLRPKEVTW